MRLVAVEDESRCADRMKIQYSGRALRVRAIPLLPIPMPPSSSSFWLKSAVLGLWMLGAAAQADDAAEVRGLIAKGNLPAALQRAEKATTARPDDAQAAFLYGVVLMDLQRDAEALAVFTQLSQRYPELPDPYNNIALLLARTGQLEAARQALESALRNDPGHRVARANLGQVHLMLAVQAWEAAATGAAADPALQRKLAAARALLAAPVASSVASSVASPVASPVAGAR